ncbi:MAG: hypothetical protein HYX20_00685 [Candidatus Yanofskybacteria bacterium]|nr:hypothetical protein [Candidatus Yanofskybacteria bacterium]
MTKSVFAMSESNRSLPVPVKFPSTTDNELKVIATKMRRSRETLQRIEKLVNKTFNLPSKSGHNFLSKLFYTVMPNMILDKLPGFVTRNLPPEELNYIHATEQLVRGYTNDVQAVIKKTRKAMEELNGTLIQLRANLQQAEEENWDAKRLQEHITQLAGFQTDEEVSGLLSAEFDRYLSDGEKEIRRINLLDILRTMIQTGEKNMCLLARFGNSELQTFQKAVIQLAGFVKFKNAAIVMKEAAEVVTGTNESVFIARDVLMVTIEQSIQAMESGLEAVAIMPKYLITGTDMQELLKRGTKQLGDGLEKVKKSDQKLFAQVQAKIVTKELAPPKPTEPVIDVEASQVKS